ncbi:MAG: sulfatase, partial [Myxococcota bacterium]
ADLSSAPPAPPPADPPPAAVAQPPNILVYLIDTLRADHLGCYGYPKPTSPAIDAFAERAVRFREARANASWTRPAVATILTGLYPITHQTQRTQDRLSDRFVTVAERLSAAGWQTAMVTTNANVARKFGFGQGFDHFDYFAERMRGPETHVRSSVAQRAALDWLDRRDPSRPFFVFVHTADPHDPYTPAPEFRRRFAADVEDRRIGSRTSMAQLESLPEAQASAQRRALISLYDGEVAQNDESFGKLLAELARRGLDRTTAVLLTSDHGEEFFEHGGWKHGQTLYEEQLRIPLVLSLPGGRGAGTVVADPVEQIDLAPTLLDLARLPIPRELPGRSLVPHVDGRSPARPGHVFYAWLETHGRALAAATRSDWKLIENRAARDPLVKAPFELYSLGSDAEERHD